jgi:hypothetical protein
MHTVSVDMGKISNRRVAFVLCLRSFNRFILVSLALLGLSVSTAQSDSINFEGPIGVPIPFFDSGLGTLDSVIVLYGLPYELRVHGEIGGGPGEVIYGLEASGDLTLSGGPTSLPSAIFNEHYEITTVLASADESLLYPIDAIVGSNAFFSGDPAVLPFIGTGVYIFSPEVSISSCISSDAELVISACEPILTTLGEHIVFYQFTPFTSVVPVPAAVWLFGTAMIGLVGLGKYRKVV